MEKSTNKKFAKYDAENNSAVLEDLSSKNFENINTALSYIERNPRIVWDKAGFLVLDKSIRELLRESVTDYALTELLERMVMLLGTIRSAEMTREFNPFNTCLEVLSHQTPTVRKEAIKTIIKIIRSCDRFNTELPEVIYETKTEIIYALENIIVKDHSDSVREIAVTAYAVLPRTSIIKRDQFLHMVLSKEKHPMIKRVIEKNLEAPPPKLNRSGVGKV